MTFATFGVAGSTAALGDHGEMEIRSLDSLGEGPAGSATHDRPLDPSGRWRWLDIEAGPGDTAELVEVTSSLGLDALSIRDAVDDSDLPKVDDFGSSLVVVLHGLAEHPGDTIGPARIPIYEVDCFLTDRVLLTVRHRPSPALEVLWTAVQQRAELTSGGADELLARLADTLTRRLVSVLDEFDTRTEELVEFALDADGQVVHEVTAIRHDLARVRRSVHPLRETLDQLRRSTSPLLTPASRRRFSDVFDVAARATSGLDGARTALTEILDAYRGSEARQATEVTKVLTVYAAIMLPLTLVVGFFGMNLKNLPGAGNDDAWIVVTAAMVIGTVVSLGVFVAVGWIHRPSGHRAGAVLGRGLVESARAPAELVGAAFEISTMPLRTVAGIGRRRDPDASAPDDD